ncbi:hypothetical protein NDI49_11615 [Trichocoleus sp. ST-U3]|uniref:hypothetical protein n=1 Tax=Coleofasciculus sp. FACHB-542 TaxID=2692787 RepID=UPI0016886438|nr:hypothetical protein [Coleofasciculus sp. FACHB-542]MBD2085071.1 hypothetical protein [Coleofasciculus sp. FACHB-542]
MFTLPMNLLFLPNLDLFVYHLRNGLGDDAEQINQNQLTFWDNFPLELQRILVAADDSNYNEPEYLELLRLAGETEAYYTFQARTEGYPVKGFYYPVRFSDSYGLLFNCHINDRDYLQSFKCFPTLKHLAADKQGNLGKTWIVSGILPRNCETPLECLAQEAYETLKFGRWKQQKPNKGKFLGATVFEVWLSPQRWDMEENHHVLVIFYPDVAAETEAAKYSEVWMQLFYYRNKIIWSYCEAQKLRQQLQENFGYIFQAGEMLKQLPLKELQRILEVNIKILSQYASDLNHLEIQLHAIETYQKKYQEHLNYLLQEASKYGETELDFLAQFNQIVKQYEIQIQQDRASFSPALRVLEDVINTIRGIVEIEQAKRDRNLENIIAAASLGVGTASVAASASSALVKDFTQPYPNQIDNQLSAVIPLANLVIVILFSIGLGCLVSGFAWKILRSRSV